MPARATITPLFKPATGERGLRRDPHDLRRPPPAARQASTPPAPAWPQGRCGRRAHRRRTGRTRPIGSFPPGYTLAISCPSPGAGRGGPVGAAAPGGAEHARPSLSVILRSPLTPQRHAFGQLSCRFRINWPYMDNAEDALRNPARPREAHQSASARLGLATAGGRSAGRRRLPDLAAFGDRRSSLAGGHGQGRCRPALRGCAERAVSAPCGQ